MIAANASDSHIFVMIVRRLTDWLTLRDYDRAKDLATKAIIRRQSRGSFLAQDGDARLSSDELLRRSRRADKKLKAIRKAMSH